MKSHFAPFALTALILCSSALPTFARAEETTPTPTAGETASGKDVSPVVGQTNDVATPGNATPSTQPGTDANKQSAQMAQGASMGNFGPIMAAIMGLFAWLLGASTLILDYSVYYSVVVMGDFVRNLSAIGVAWRVLRDIGNVFLIFGFLIAGIATIINLNIFGYGKKMLPMLLVAAVFLNFSLFISEAIIDVGNLFATQFYTQINGGQIVGPAQFNTSSPVVNEGISNRLMSVLGLQSIYRAAAVENGTIDNGSGPKSVLRQNAPWYVGFMAIILFIIASFVMLSLAFILIARFVALIFLIVIAPIGFAGLAIPKLSGIANKWWSNLAEQTITAPTLLLLLYIALAVITDAKFLTGVGVAGADASKNAWTAFLGGEVTAFAGILFAFLVAMALLLAVVVIAKQMSAFGAGVATKWAGRLSGLTLAAAAPGFVGRQTVGRASQIGGRYLRRTSFARIPILGSGVVGILDRGAKASFDTRPKGPVKAMGQEVVNLGTPQKGGYRKVEEDATKARETYAKSLKQTGAEKKAQEGAERGQATEQGRQQMMERTIRDLETQKRIEMDELRNTHASEIRRLEVPVSDAQRRLVAAEQADRTNSTPLTRAEIGVATLLRTAAMNTVEARRAEQRREQAQEQRVHDDMIAAQQEEVRVHRQAATDYQTEANRMKNIAQEQYATSLQSRAVYGFGGFRARNKVAAENILKEAKKKQSEKDLDTIRRALERGDEAPTPPAPGGGGTPPP